MINKISEINKRITKKLTIVRTSLLEDTNINNSQFEVLHYLNTNSDCTISSIARAQDVSRQHIQKTITSMLELKLVKTRKNRRHSRSAFIELTTRGARLLEIIQTAEHRIYRKMNRDYDKNELQLALKVLEQLDKQLESEVFSLYD